MNDQGGERRGTEAFREQVIQAAIQLFADRGFAGTSVQDIAEAVGSSKQLVLYHFGAKDAIRDAVLASIRDAWKDFMPVLVDLVTTEGDRVAAASMAFQRFLALHPHAPRLILRDLITEGGEVRQALYDLVRPYMRLTADAIIRARGASGEHGADAMNRAMAQVQVMGVLLISVHAIYNVDPEPLEGALPPELVFAETAEMIRRYLQG